MKKTIWKWLSAASLALAAAAFATLATPAALEGQGGPGNWVTQARQSASQPGSLAKGDGLAEEGSLLEEGGAQLSDEQKAAKEVVDLVNQERKKAGKAPLAANESLAGAAQVRAVEIAQAFSHTRPDGSPCFTVFGQLGIDYEAAGENLAAGFHKAKDAMEGWMDSPSHKKNLLAADFTDIGVACSKEGGETYWVQLFLKN